MFEPVSNHRPNGQAPSALLARTVGSSARALADACARCWAAVKRACSTERKCPMKAEHHTPDSSAVVDMAQPSDSHAVAPAPMTAAAIAKSRGSGLGLPVARLMARVLGGDCDLMSIQDGANAGKQNTAFLVLLPFSALQKGTTVVHEYPLFGRSGHLSADSRMTVRRLVQEAVNGSGTSGSQRQLPKLQYENLSLQRRGSIRSVLSDGAREVGSFHKKVTELMGITNATTNLEQSRTAESSGSALSTHTEPAQRRHCAPPVQSTELGHVLGPAAASSDGSGRHINSFSDPRESPSSTVVTNATTVNTAEATPSIVLPEARSLTDSCYTGSRTSGGGHTPLLHGRSSSKVVPMQLDSEQDVVIAVSKIAPVAGAVRYSSRWFGSLVTASAQPPAVRTRDGSAAAGALSPKSPLRAQLTSLHDCEQAAQPARILYADDDAINRKLLARMLQRLSTQAQSKTGMRAYELVCVSDGWEALVALYEAGQVCHASLQQARSAWMDSTDTGMEMPAERGDMHSARRFDLLLLDIDMPRATGDQVAGVLRSQGRLGVVSTSHTPIVAVTGRSVGFEILEGRLGTMSESERNLCHSGMFRPVLELSHAALRPCFDGALGKPFKAEQLTALCEILLQNEKRTGQVYGGHVSVP